MNRKRLLFQRGNGTQIENIFPNINIDKKFPINHSLSSKFEILFFTFLCFLVWFITGC